jgi:hypothetical protein
MSDTELMHKIALGLIPGIGDINARKLVSFTGSVDAVFSEPYGSSDKNTRNRRESGPVNYRKKLPCRSRKEAEWVTKQDITTLFT